MISSMHKKKHSKDYFNCIFYGVLGLGDSGDHVNLRVDRHGRDIPTFGVGLSVKGM